MYFDKFVVFCVLGFLLRNSISETPGFRILAPPFLCPKDKESLIDKPDNTVITLQADSDVDMIFKWTVHWTPLLVHTQRFTVALWKTVRALEKYLNGVQAERGVYVINNTELLSGVNYVFNVTASYANESAIVKKSFEINNMQGNQKLVIEGRSDMFSIILVGSQLVYADQEYIIEAQVTTCYKTHDYYFVWSVFSGDNEVNVSDIEGSRLEIKAGNLIPGVTYEIVCQVFKYSSFEYIAGNDLQFKVLHRDLDINFNFDVLVISVGTPFYIHTDIYKTDYCSSDLSISWECKSNNVSFDDFEINGFGSLAFPLGLPNIGEYYISVTVLVLNSGVSSISTTRMKIVQPGLPVIEVHLVPRRINEDNLIALQANVSHIRPGCTIAWYFRYEECLSLTNADNMNKCTDNEHGVPISESINFYSLEHNFLDELTDYTNETAWKYLKTEIHAAVGTARILAQCECNTARNCDTEYTVYADMKIIMNKKPDVGEVVVKPDIGTAMETVFRISAPALQNPNRPHRYSFYCDLGNNESLVLGVNLDYLAIETLLPYVDNGTSVWIEVCDSLGSCSVSTLTLVRLSSGQARTLEVLIDDMQAFLKRCEFMFLRRLVTSAVITYLNTGQTDAYIKFTAAVLKTLEYINEGCVDIKYEEYKVFVNWLTKIGVKGIN